MVCKVCGGTLTETDKFCRFCGTTVSAAPQQPPVVENGPGCNAPAGQEASAPQPTYIPSSQTGYTPAPQPTYTPASQGSYKPTPQPTYTPASQGSYKPTPQPAYTPAPQAAYNPAPQGGYAPQQPKAAKKGAHLKASAPKKRGKGLLIGGCIAAAVVLIVLVVGLIIFSSPTVRVGLAMKNSADAFGKIGKVWHTDELAELSRMEAYSMSIDAQINSVSDDVIYYYADAFSGLGGRVDMDVNLENREIGMMASARMGKTELATAMFSMEDEMLYLGVPDFLDDFYGVNTETLMRDLEDMGLDVGEAADISINLFDLIEIVQKYAGDTEEMRQELTAAITGLTKEITVEKAGKEMVKVGGESLKCQGYTVTIPQDALEGLVDVILDQADKDPMDMMEEIFESMSLPGEITEELMDELRYEYEYSQLDYDAVYDFLDVIGDLELQVYLKSNKVAGIVYEEKFDGTKLEIGLYAGGDQYGNSLKLELKVDGEKLTVESEGDHFAKSGVFTDKLTVKPPYGGSMKLETEYEPKSGELALSCSIAELKFKAEGTYAVTGSSYALALDEISLSDSGEEMLSVAFSWEIIEYAKRVRVSDARMITDLDDTDLENLMQELEGNAMEWAMKLTASHPELLEYLGIY